MKMTAEKLQKLVTKKPYEFLCEFSIGSFSVDLSEKPEDQSVEEYFEEHLDNEGSNRIGYLDNYLMNKPFMGLHLEQEHAVGGGEGGGENVERVWSVRIGGTERSTKYGSHVHKDVAGGEVLAYIRATGYYQSYDGTEFNDDAQLVFPAEVTVTQFFTKQAHAKLMKKRAADANK